MTTTTTSSARDGDAQLRVEESTREALTRILAIESRNALARVELAASELARFESTPAAVDRISTIHHAVDQIDGLLAKIDLLASPPIERRWPVVEVDRVWQRIRKRLEPTLLARGIRFRSEPELLAGEDPSQEETVERADVCVEMPELALESVFCALLRVVLAASERDQELRFELEQGSDGFSAALVVLPCTDHGRRLEIDRDDWIELEVQLAEWGGTVARESLAGPDRVQIFIPAGPLDV